MKTNMNLVGEIRAQKNGIKAECLAQYGRYVDVKFIGGKYDGVISKRIRRCRFINGELTGRSYKTRDVIDRTGETRLMNNGQKATVTKYISSDYCTICFEDGWTTTCEYASFLKGTIQNKNPEFIRQQLVDEFVGQKFRQKDGHSVQGVAVTDEGKLIVKNGKELRYYSKQTIRNGAVHRKQTADRVGEVHVLKDGTKATIIEYNAATDVVVMLDNGLVKRTRYSELTSGRLSSKLTQNTTTNKKIANARNKNAHTSARLGEIRTMNCGSKAEIVGYASCHNITVKFENGVIKTTTYRAFCLGSISDKEKKVNLSDIINCAVVEAPSSAIVKAQKTSSRSKVVRAYVRATKTK